MNKHSIFPDIITCQVLSKVAFLNVKLYIFSARLCQKKNKQTFKRFAGVSFHLISVHVMLRQMRYCTSTSIRNVRMRACAHACAGEWVGKTCVTNSYIVNSFKFKLGGQVPDHVNSFLFCFVTSYVKNIKKGFKPFSACQYGGKIN